MELFYYRSHIFLLLCMCKNSEDLDSSYDIYYYVVDIDI
jgi:hypothetical protein